MFNLSETVQMDGYKGDGQTRIGRVESVSGRVITLQCHFRSQPDKPVFRSYVASECNNLRTVHVHAN